MNLPASYLLIVGGFGGFIAASIAVIFAWQNLSSQGLVFGVAAFVGTFVLLAIQILLESKRSEVKDLITSEYTYDGLLPEVASAFYADTHPGSVRGILEKDTSAGVAENNLDSFKRAPELLAQDMAIASLVGMFFSYQPDWQLRHVISNARYTFGFMGAEKLSRESDCTTITSSDAGAQLRKSGNAFASIELARWGNDKICLPPNSQFKVTGHTLTIETPQCVITFSVKVPNGSLFGVPKLMKIGQSRTIEDVWLEDGKPRFINMPVPIEVSVVYRALYATHRDMERVRSWVTATIKATHEWFEGTGAEFYKLRSPLEKDEAARNVEKQ